MNRDFKAELRNFDAVWQRVTEAKAKPEGVKLMPRWENRPPKSRCRRKCR